VRSHDRRPTASHAWSMTVSRSAISGRVASSRAKNMDVCRLLSFPHDRARRWHLARRLTLAVVPARFFLPAPLLPAGPASSCRPRFFLPLPARSEVSRGLALFVVHMTWRAVSSGWRFVLARRYIYQATAVKATWLRDHRRYSGSNDGTDARIWQNEPKFNLKRLHICFRVIRAGSQSP
jgi:hypothetical protein